MANTYYTTPKDDPKDRILNRSKSSFLGFTNFAFCLFGMVIPKRTLVAHQCHTHSASGFYRHDLPFLNKARINISIVFYVVFLMALFAKRNIIFFFSSILMVFISPINSFVFGSNSTMFTYLGFSFPSAYPIM